MNKGLNVFVGVVVLALLVVASGLFYVVDETQQAVITQFGEPIGDPITEAGLYFKIPIVQTVNYFEKRLLQWDGDPNEIQTLEKRYIWVDTTARWRIKDALKFMQSVRTEVSAQARLDDIIDGATRDVIASHKQIESLRSTNRLLEESENVVVQMDDFGNIRQTRVEKINLGREQLSLMIKEQSDKLVDNLGIEIIDVRIKRINYIQSVRNKVYDRMISERNAVAANYRSEGQGKRAEIEGRMGKELKNIQAEAYKKSQEIKGQGDAKAIKIYADAYNKDPDFYTFVKTLETYGKTINNKTTLLLSADNEFFNLLNGAGKTAD